MAFGTGSIGSYEMFTKEGEDKVAKIVDEACGLFPAHMEYQRVGYALNWLKDLARYPGFEEATDTAVREAVIANIQNRSHRGMTRPRPGGRRGRPRGR